jgi:hypothetical protein
MIAVELLGATTAQPRRVRFLPLEPDEPLTGLNHAARRILVRQRVDVRPQHVGQLLLQLLVALSKIGQRLALPKLDRPGLAMSESSDTSSIFFSTQLSRSSCSRVSFSPAAVRLRMLFSAIRFACVTIG